MEACPLSPMATAFFHCIEDFSNKMLLQHAADCLKVKFKFSHNSFLIPKNPHFSKFTPKQWNSLIFYVSDSLADCPSGWCAWDKSSGAQVPAKNKKNQCNIYRTLGKLLKISRLNLNGDIEVEKAQNNSLSLKVLTLKWTKVIIKGWLLHSATSSPLQPAVVETQIVVSSWKTMKHI